MKKFSFFSNSFGFTLIEVILVVAVVFTLLGFITINLPSAQRKTNLNSATQTLLADLNSQKIRAMVGDGGQSASPSAYGIHFGTIYYSLFKGSFVSSESADLTVDLPSNLQFQTTGDVTFSEITGELASPKSLTIIDTTSSDSQTLQLNIYGVVTQIN